MNCESFHNWLEREGPLSAGRMPRTLAEHLRECPGCRALLEEEHLWKRLLVAAPEAKLPRSLWPGILAHIEEREARGESLFGSLVLLGQRMVPALALVLLLLGVAATWSGMISSPPDPTVSTLLAFAEIPQGEDYGRLLGRLAGNNGE